MILQISNCTVSVSDKGSASVDYMGGSLWLPSSACKGVKAGEYKSLSLEVRLRSFRSSDRSYTALFPVRVLPQ